MNKNFRFLMALSATVALLISGCSKDDETTDDGSAQYSVNFNVTHGEGFVKDATVCFDTNFNLRCDSGELSALSDSKGKANIKPKDNKIPKSAILVEIKKDVAVFTADGSKAGSNMLILEEIVPSVHLMSADETHWPSLLGNYRAEVYRGNSVHSGWNDPDYKGTQTDIDEATVESEAAYIVEERLNSILETSGIVWEDDDNNFVKFGVKTYLLSDICRFQFCGNVPAPSVEMKVNSASDTPTGVADAVTVNIDYTKIGEAVSKMRQAYSDGTWQSTHKFPRRDSVN